MPNFLDRFMPGVDQWIPKPGSEAGDLTHMRLANIYGQRNQRAMVNGQNDADVKAQYNGPPVSAVKNLVRNTNEAGQLVNLDTDNVQKPAPSSTALNPMGAAAGLAGGFNPEAMAQGMQQAGITPDQYARAIRTKADVMGATPGEAGAAAQVF